MVTARFLHHVEGAPVVDGKHWLKLQHRAQGRAEGSQPAAAAQILKISHGKIVHHLLFCAFNQQGGFLDALPGFPGAGGHLHQQALAHGA